MERRLRARRNGTTPEPSSEGRSRNMQAIRRSDTKPERVLRSALHRAGLRFRKDLSLRLSSGRRVRPDIVFTRQRVAVFYDSCFWHSCPQHGRVPSANEWYWAPKLARTVERDMLTNRDLKEDGWIVLRFWEHDPLQASAQRVVDQIDSRRVRSGR
ncbi:very short patch repair endonuclease [Asanoa sp. WMMD1127]|nr:very short patch repair endonuclease [Asanoa sp. WMMD1127]MDG4822003.1 very short patch repair endonuclease [Asanoa sp. WMMD1127]